MNSDSLVAAGVSTLAQAYLRSREWKMAYTGSGYVSEEIFWWLMLKPTAIVIISTINLNDNSGSTAFRVCVSIVLLLVTELLIPNSLVHGFEDADTMWNVLGLLSLTLGVLARTNADGPRHQRLNPDNRGNNDRYVLQF